MTNRNWMSLAGLLLLCVSPAMAADAYVSDVEIISVAAGSAEDIAVVGSRADVPTGDEEGPVVIGGIEEIRIDDLLITFDGGGKILWNGKSEPPADAGVESLMSPRLIARAGEPAMVVAATRLQYFQREGEAWNLRVTEQDSAPGIEFGLTVEPAESGMVVVDYDLKLTMMEGREKIEGVHLDVGRPVLRTTHVQSRVKFEPGQWIVISGKLFKEAKKKKGDFLLVLLKVEPA